jgi:hypothetical protein
MSAELPQSVLDKADSTLTKMLEEIEKDKSDIDDTNITKHVDENSGYGSFDNIKLPLLNKIKNVLTDPIYRIIRFVIIKELTDKAKDFNNYQDYRAYLYRVYSTDLKIAKSLLNVAYIKDMAKQIKCNNIEKIITKNEIKQSRQKIKLTTEESIQKEKDYQKRYYENNKKTRISTRSIRLNTIYSILQGYLNKCNENTKYIFIINYYINQPELKELINKIKTENENIDDDELMSKLRLAISNKQEEKSVTI